MFRQTTNVHEANERGILGSVKISQTFAICNCIVLIISKFYSWIIFYTSYLWENELIILTIQDWSETITEILWVVRLLKWYSRGFAILMLRLRHLRHLRVNLSGISRTSDTHESPTMKRSDITFSPRYTWDSRATCTKRACCTSVALGPHWRCFKRTPGLSKCNGLSVRWGHT